MMKKGPMEALALVVTSVATHAALTNKLEHKKGETQPEPVDYKTTVMSFLQTCERNKVVTTQQ